MHACSFAVIEIMLLCKLICFLLWMHAPSQPSIELEKTSQGTARQFPGEPEVSARESATNAENMEDTPEEAVEELDADEMVSLAIDQDTTGTDRVRIYRGELILAFTEVAVENELDHPIPERGVGRCKYHSFQTKCIWIKTFLESTKTLSPDPYDCCIIIYTCSTHQTAVQKTQKCTLRPRAFAASRIACLPVSVALL